MTRTPIRYPSPIVRLIIVRCPRCGKVYTRATVGSVVEVACRGCKATEIVTVAA